MSRETEIKEQKQAQAEVNARDLVQNQTPVQMQAESELEAKDLELKRMPVQMQSAALESLERDKAQTPASEEAKASDKTSNKTSNKTSDSQFHLYIRLLKYLKPYGTMFAFGTLAAIPSGGMDSVIAWLAGEGLKRVFDDHQTHLLAFVPLGVLAVASTQGIARYFEAYCIRYVGAAGIRDLRNELFRHLQKQPLLYFHGQSSGVLIGRLINDVAIVEAAISQTFQSLVSRAITLISLTAVILLKSFGLAMIALPILSLIVIPVAILGKKIRKSSRGGQENIGDLVSVLSESIQGAKIVQSYNLENFQINRFETTNGAFFKNTLKAVRAEAIMSPILAMIGAVGIACVIWVAGAMVMNKQMDLGALTSFVIALILLYSPIKNIGRVNGILQPALAAASRIFEVLDHQSDLTDCANPIDLKSGPHTVKFDHVCFRYPNHDAVILDDISIELPPAKMIALVGLSGSGKSTFANLVPRFFDVSGGTIFIDDIPLPKISLKSLRQEIAIVTQDNFLFNTSIEENIRFGNIEASQEQLIEAARAAYCHDFIEAMPQGYNTVIGERGLRLSGGQQQRIAIARAFLKNAPILILDEATSALDNESEAMVQQALNKLMEGRTTIVIAHRLTTVQHADQIVVLDQGRIVEKGTHRELLAKEATYARLVQAQFERLKEAEAN